MRRCPLPLFVLVLLAAAHPTGADEPAIADAQAPILAGPEHGGGDAGNNPRTFSGARVRQQPGERLEALIESLNLTDDQRQRVDALVGRFTQQTIVHRKLAGKLRAQVQHDQQAGDAEQLARARAELRRHVADRPKPTDLLIDMAELLNAEQKAKLRSIIATQRAGRQAMRGDPVETFAMATRLLDLTDAQRDAIDQRVGVYRQQRHDFEAEHGSAIKRLLGRMRQAREAGDVTAQRAARDAYRELQLKSPASWKVVRELTRQLTADQRRQLRLMRDGAKPDKPADQAEPAGDRLDL